MEASPASGAGTGVSPSTQLAGPAKPSTSGSGAASPLVYTMEGSSGTIGARSMDYPWDGGRLSGKRLWVETPGCEAAAAQGPLFKMIKKVIMMIIVIIITLNILLIH
jgi:hypothetical protein